MVDAPRRIKLAFNATNTSMLNASRAAAWEYQQQPKNLIELEERFFLVFRLLLEDLILLSLKILSFAGFLFSLRKKALFIGLGRLLTANRHLWGSNYKQTHKNWCRKSSNYGNFCSWINWWLQKDRWTFACDDVSSDCDCDPERIVHAIFRADSQYLSIHWAPCLRPIPFQYLFFSISNRVQSSRIASGSKQYFWASAERSVYNKEEENDSGMDA